MYICVCVSPWRLQRHTWGPRRTHQVDRGSIAPNDDGRAVCLQHRRNGSKCIQSQTPASSNQPHACQSIWNTGPQNSTDLHGVHTHMQARVCANVVHFMSVCGHLFASLVFAGGRAYRLRNVRSNACSCFDPKAVSCNCGTTWSAADAGPYRTARHLRPRLQLSQCVYGSL
jgi:hypothetical protein